MNPYNQYISKIKDLYPDIYLKLIDYPEETMLGMINEMHTNRINLEDEEKCKDFFDRIFALTRYVEYSYKSK